MFSIFAYLRKLFGARPPVNEATEVTERHSIETIQTDTSYSNEKESEQKQPMPKSAPTWTLPLCGPLLNNLRSPSSTSTLCEDCRAEAEKDGFVVIDDPFAEENATQAVPVPVSVQEQTKEPKCEFDYGKGSGGRRRFIMKLTEDMDDIVKPKEIMLLVNMLENLRNGVAGETPITPSTRSSAKLIKTRAARWGDSAAKQVDEYLKEEKAKVIRIWRREEESGEGMDGKDIN